MVGIACGRGVAREVLSTGEDSRGAESGIKDSRLLDDLVGSRSVTASTKGVVGFLVEGDIKDGAEVEVETENPKELSGQFAMAGDEFGIALVAELAGIRRLVAEEFQSGDAASFLVDRNDRFNVAEFRRRSVSARSWEGVWMFLPKRMNPPGWTRLMKSS